MCRQQSYASNSILTLFDMLEKKKYAKKSPFVKKFFSTLNGSYLSDFKWQ